jgi:hypothetical protein
MCCEVWCVFWSVELINCCSSSDADVDVNVDVIGGCSCCWSQSWSCSGIMALVNAVEDVDFDVEDIVDVEDVDVDVDDDGIGPEVNA